MAAASTSSGVAEAVETHDVDAALEAEERLWLEGFGDEPEADEVRFHSLHNDANRFKSLIEHGV